MLPGLSATGRNHARSGFRQLLSGGVPCSCRAGESAGGCEIYSVGYADGGTTEYPVIAGEGYNEIDVPAERMAEQFVRVQLHFLHAGRIFVVIGICGYLQQHSYTLLFQHPHEVYGEGVGVVIGADIRIVCLPGERIAG